MGNIFNEDFTSDKGFDVIKKLVAKSQIWKDSFCFAHKQIDMSHLLLFQ